MQPTTLTEAPAEEYVLAFPSKLLGDKPRQGFLTDSHTLDLVGIYGDASVDSPSNGVAVWLPRSEADRSPEFKQPIVYAYVTRVSYGVRRYLVYQRGKSGGEGRLHAKLSLGIGGHVSKDRDHSVRCAVVSEIEEELPGALHHHASLVGAINDDSDEVGRVHIGAVFRIEVDHSTDITSPDPAIVEPRWVTFEYLQEHAEHFENWSQILIREHLTR